MNEAVTKYYKSDAISKDFRLLNENELAYIGEMQKNEALYEYFMSIKDQLTATLLLSKVNLNG